MTSALEKLTALYSNHGPRIAALFKASIGLLGQQELTALIIHRALFTTICHAFFLLSCGMMTFDWHRGWGVFLMVVMVLVIYPYSFFLPYAHARETDLVFLCGYHRSQHSAGRSRTA